jgi:hypothetical protein
VLGENAAPIGVSTSTNNSVTAGGIGGVLGGATAIPGCTAGYVTQASLTGGVTVAQGIPSSGTAAPILITQVTSQSLVTSSPTILPIVGSTVSARGLDASNNVRQQASGTVRVAGSNFAPINVAVEIVTRVVDLGTALVNGIGRTIGDTVAAVTGGASNQRATLDQNTTVTVMGDNRTPIDVFVDYVVRLFASGRATATAGRDGSTDGRASALGMWAQNSVDLSARVLVDVRGSNYAPIRLHVRLVTEIEDRGSAEASAGSALGTSAIPLEAWTSSVACVGDDSRVLLGNAQQAAVTPSSRADRAANASSNTIDVNGAASCSSGDAIGVRRAISGNAIAVGTRAAVDVLSGQVATAAVHSSAPETPAQAATAPGNSPAGNPASAGDTRSGAGSRISGVAQLPGTATGTSSPWIFAALLALFALGAVRFRQ